MYSKNTLKLASRYQTISRLLEQENNLIARYDGYYCDSYAIELEQQRESVYLDLLDSIENDKINRVLNK